MMKRASIFCTAALIACISLLTASTVEAQAIHEVQCGPIDSACECDAAASVCLFQFYVEEVLTFTRYNLSRPHTEGELFYIDEAGNVLSYEQKGICVEENFVKYTRFGYNGVPVEAYCIENNDTRVCTDKGKLCTDPLTVDGRTFKMILAVNKQFPGPTLIVHEGQIVAVDVHNNLSSEGTSIHWHGQHLIGTNYMDGVGLLTQCPIQPGSTFRYIFRAKPSGTFWYHSHMGSQRTKGIFGALIVKERDLTYPIQFEDDPAAHTLTVMDWYRDDFDFFFRRERFATGNYPNLPYFTVPTPPDKQYSNSVGPDQGEIGNNPFWSGLIHGKGRHSSVPYEQSSLRVYEVVHGRTYRFRLIHTGIHYAFFFSIEGHKLTVMATDGYVVQPVEVDYIGLHSGERYDFLVEANQTRGDYWMKAETFEAEFYSGTGPPFLHHNHSAEAILHYFGSEKPKSTQFSNIPQYPKECTQENPCKMINCPFGAFHTSYNIECIAVDSLRLVSATPQDEMPNVEPDVTYFMNVAGFVTREKPISSINDKHFRFPLYPLTTHYKMNEEAQFCDVASECNETGGCQCTTVMDLDFNATVRVVISAIGEERNATHPMHFHGHSVHVLKVGYGAYSTEDGSLLASSRDLTCIDGDDSETLDQNRCPNARFRDPDTKFSVNEYTVRKDTIIVPTGGYIVLQFRANNPGFWFLHCHVELHQREGMALVMREAVDQMNSAPKEMETCVNFVWDIAAFNASLSKSCAGRPTVGRNLLAISLCILLIIICTTIIPQFL